MKIKAIELKNNSILGDLFIDCTNEEGEIADTVILAGENGTGKSTIFNIIYEFSNYNLVDRPSNEIRIFNVELSDKEIQIVSNNENVKNFLRDANFANNELFFEFDFSFVHNWNQVKVKFTDSNGDDQKIDGSIFADQEIKPIFRSIFSDVEIKFNPNNITSVTSMDVDNDVKNSVKSSSNLATEVTQLLIDVQALDDSAISNEVRRNPDRVINLNELNLRMSRFERAFNFMFINKKYKEVINNDNSKKVIFEEFGKEISIDKLSSGEKQIAFRGGFLLKDRNSINTSFVLIDEPEISLHPEWQLKILEFYKRLLIDDNGNQTSQMFIATHSPFIIHNNNRYNDKVVVLKKDEEGNTYIPGTKEFYGWEPKVKIKEAFNINLEADINRPIVYVEGETDELYINKAIEILDIDLDINVKWIGRNTGKGKVEFTGYTALNQSKAFFQSNPHILKQKTILLYDSDTNKSIEDDNNLFIRCMPKNMGNKIFGIGIENLLTLPEDHPRDMFYDNIDKETINNYGGKEIFQKEELNKKRLCKWICNEINYEDQKIYFKEFQKIIDILKAIINK